MSASKQSVIMAPGRETPERGGAGGPESATQPGR
nr:hypothetical protein [Human alphaherpesvirus 2]